MLNNDVISIGYIGDDDYTIKYKNDVNNLLDELERRENSTERPVVNTSEVEFLTRTELLSKGFVCKSGDHNYFLKVQDMIYPVAENAYVSIQQRVEMTGKGFNKLKERHPDKFALIINTLLKEHKSVRVIVIDNKVRAIFSAANGGYKVMPVKDVIENTLDVLQGKFSNLHFDNATVTYDALYMDVLFPEKTEIQDLYGKPVEYIPGVRVRASDTGFAANEYFPIFNVSGGCVVFGDLDETVRIIHRGKDASIDNLRDDLPNIFLKLRNTIGAIQSQKAYKLNFPEEVIEKACKKLKLCKKDERQMKERLNLHRYVNPDKDITAYDITRMFIEMAKDESNENKKRTLETAAGKAFNLNYQKLDNLD